MNDMCKKEMEKDDTRRVQRSEVDENGNGL